MACSAGLTFRKEGGAGMSVGRSRCACEMAACTSCAAASIFRARSNWIVTRVVPSELVEVIDSIPAMVENSFSSGVATEEAMVSGLAPGRLAETVIVGKSTFGRSLTGSFEYAKSPATRMEIMTSVVMTGRLTYGSVRFMAQVSVWPLAWERLSPRWPLATGRR